MSAQRFKFWIRCPKCMINQISCIKSRVILTEKILTNITTTKSQICLMGSWLIFTVNLNVFRRNKETDFRLIGEELFPGWLIWKKLFLNVDHTIPHPGIPEWMRQYKTSMTSHVSLNPDSRYNVTNYNCPAIIDYTLKPWVKINSLALLLLVGYLVTAVRKITNTKGNEQNHKSKN